MKPASSHSLFGFLFVALALGVFELIAILWRSGAFETRL